MNSKLRAEQAQQAELAQLVTYSSPKGVCWGPGGSRPPKSLRDFLLPPEGEQWEGFRGGFPSPHRNTYRPTECSDERSEEEHEGGRDVFLRNMNSRLACRNRGAEERSTEWRQDRRLFHTGRIWGNLRAGRRGDSPNQDSRKTGRDRAI